MGVVKWALVLFAVTALGLVVTSKVITFMNPPRPGRARPAALGRVDRALFWTVLGGAVLGLAVLVTTLLAAR
ncbi:MAG: hypothetical protein L0027_04000 [Candidatus Rokubacteria bacterium]|nr:hypothetical protein [Candidatus Rokubacteria bacterium]